MANMFRQGDVLIIELPLAPALGPEVPLTGMGPVLALGELTGHHHTVVAEPHNYNAAQDLGDVPVDGSDLTLREIAVRAIEECLTLSAVNRGEPAARLYEPRPSDGTRDRTLVVTRHTILRHDEHGCISLAPGAYTVRIQREWFGADSRQVED